MSVTTNYDRSQKETMAQNVEAFNPRIPRGLTRKPEYHVYIHTVSKREFPFDHLLFPRQKLKACPDGERYATCMAIPEPVIQIAPDEANGGRRGYEESAWRCAIDILNPNNLGMDPYAKLDPSTFISANCDLIKQGLWPSMNKVPPAEEIERAEKAREDYYRSLTEKATQLDSLNKRADLDELLSSNPDVGVAMDAFGLTAPWHRKPELRQACPNCGDQVRVGIAFHVTDGRDCILDWKKAYEAGRVKKDDVPPGKRWQGFGKVEVA